MTIEQAQKKIDDWIQKYGVRYFNELTNLAILTEEVGELASLIARVYGEQSFKSTPEMQPKELIADEMADVFFVLVCLANQMDIDLSEAIEANLAKKTNRDKNRHKTNKKLSQ